MDDRMTNEGLKGRWVDFSSAQQVGSRSEVVRFPFATHSELAKGMEDGDVSLPMSASAMFEVAKLVSTAPWTLFVLSNLVPLAVVLVAVVALSNWWFLVALLAMPVALGLFHPSTKETMRPIRGFLVFCSYVGLATGVIQTIWWLAIVCGISSFYHITWGVSAAFSRILADQAMKRDESLFRELWQNEQVFVRMKDGRTFFPE